MCDDKYFPQVLLGSHAQAAYVMSRNNFSTVVPSVTATNNIVVGLEDAKLSLFTPATAGPVYSAATTVLSAIQTNMAVMPLVALTCMKSGVRIYQYY